MLSENSLRSARLVLGLACLASVCLASSTVLRGRLAGPEVDEPLGLITAGGEGVTLELDEVLDQMMRDPQLADRNWEVRGERREDGRFAVLKAFTIKDGELHRVTYYCEICHITTYAPGRCMCCQEDTELRELPGE